MKKQEKTMAQYLGMGIGFVGFGVLILLQKNGVVSQFTNPLIFLPLLAAWFIGWGILSKESGLFIPGGIFTGISLGLLLLDSPLAQYAAVEDGVFMIGFAMGWVSISLLTAVFNQKRILWPLIPASIIGFVGFSISFGGYGLALVVWLLEQGVMLILGLFAAYLVWGRNSKTDKAINA